MAGCFPHYAKIFLRCYSWLCHCWYWNIRTSLRNYSEDFENNWRGHTNTQWRKMYFCIAGDIVLWSSHIEKWSQTWSCKSWRIKPRMTTREQIGCHFYAWYNPFQISCLIYHRKHSVWDHWHRNMYIFSGKDVINCNFVISEIFCIRTGYWQFSSHNNEHFYIDAHMTVLSATLLQVTTIANAKLVEFSSRATMSVKSCYPQLDLKTQAIGFGLRRLDFC